MKKLRAAFDICVFEMKNEERSCRLYYIYLYINIYICPWNRKTEQETLWLDFANCTILPVSFHAMQTTLWHMACHSISVPASALCREEGEVDIYIYIYNM
jgi:hypothetical protein